MIVTFIIPKIIAQKREIFNTLVQHLENGKTLENSNFEKSNYRHLCIRYI